LGRRSKNRTRKREVEESLQKRSPVGNGKRSARAPREKNGQRVAGSCHHPAVKETRQKYLGKPRTFKAIKQNREGAVGFFFSGTYLLGGRGHPGFAF